MTTRQTKLTSTGINLLIVLCNAGCAQHRMNCQSCDPSLIRSPISGYETPSGAIDIKDFKTQTAIQTLPSQDLRKKVNDMDGELNRLQDRVTKLEADVTGLKQKVPGDAIKSSNLWTL